MEFAENICIPFSELLPFLVVTSFTNKIRFNILVKGICDNNGFCIVIINNCTVHNVYSFAFHTTMRFLSVIIYLVILLYLNQKNKTFNM